MSDVLERLGATLRDRYTLERQVGEGGMATVFLAEDVKHRRQVALKVMRPELAASIGSDRFLREIEVAAKLQHPHIVPVYDSGAADGFLYYVMPFVEGESLRERLRRDGSLPIAEAIRITGEAASALGYAHGHGLVHRDIKPENILISAGHAVVADFGIARAVNAAAAGGGTAFTGLGVAIGTPAYMSPEQATAEAVDARSDQYSLACVTYEMLAGRPAFSGTTAQSIITANITGPRPRVRAVRKGVPDAVERVLLKALDTDSSKRYDSVTAFADALDTASRSAASSPDLRRWGAIAALLVVVLVTAAWWMLARDDGPVVAAAERIAVMPFRSSGPGAELLGEGMVDLLATNLNGVGGVQTVEPRTVLQQIERRGGGTPDLEGALGIARDVEAGSVLLGSVVATGTRVRLSADLYARDGSQLANAQVDGHADSVLSLVDGLSIELMRSIWRSQEPIPAMHVGALTTTSVSAMREYLAGERFYRRSQWDSAIVHFNEAVTADSTFALAHYRLASSYGWVGDQNDAPSARASAMAVKFADRLPAREQTLVRAYQLFQGGDPVAIDTMRRYVQSFPQDPDGWYLLGEAQFHSRFALGLAPATLMEPFDRVLRLDSSLTPAAIHPLELMLMHRDSAAFGRYLRALRSAGATAEARNFELAQQVMWGSVGRDSALAELMATASFGRVGATLLGLFKAPNATSDSVVGVIRAAGSAAESQGRVQLVSAEPAVLVGLGRLDEAWPLIDSMMRAGNQDAAFGALYTPYWGGYAPEGWGEQYLRTMEERAPRDNPFVLIILATNTMVRGSTAGVDAMLGQARAMDSIPARMRGVLEALAGWKQVMDGDTIAGVARMQRGLRNSGSMAQGGLVAPIRYQYARLLASRPDTRDAGIRWLRYGMDQDISLGPIVALSLAEAYEAAGNRQAAAEQYGRFIRLWDKADPVLEPKVAAARQALQELTAEPR